MDDKMLYDKMYEKTRMGTLNTSRMFQAEGVGGITSHPTSNVAPITDIRRISNPENTGETEDTVMWSDPIVRSPHNGHQRVIGVARTNGRTVLVTRSTETVSESDDPPMVLLKDIQRIYNTLKYHPNPDIDRVMSTIIHTLNEILADPLRNRQDVENAISRLYHNLTIL